MGECEKYIEVAFDDVEDENEFKKAVVTTLEYLAKKIDLIMTITNISNE